MKMKTTTTTSSELVLHHDKVTVPSDLMVSSIKPLEGGLTNDISIFGDTIVLGTNTSHIYLYGHVHTEIGIRDKKKYP